MGCLILCLGVHVCIPEKAGWLNDQELKINLESTQPSAIVVCQGAAPMHVAGTWSRDLCRGGSELASYLLVSPLVSGEPRNNEGEKTHANNANERSFMYMAKQSHSAL